MDTAQAKPSLGIEPGAIAIISKRHTMRRHRYITFWRPDNAGYCWPLSWAGQYTREAVTAKPRYYNDGDGAIAVPFSAIERMFDAPDPGDIDGDAGPIVRNTRANWLKIKAAALSQGAQAPILNTPHD